MKVAVLGVGLIGGSIGLAARGRADAEVCGYDPDERVRARALELGAIDTQAPDIAGAVAGADVVFAAAPIGSLSEVVRLALSSAAQDCVGGWPFLATRFRVVDLNDCDRGHICGNLRRIANFGH